MSYIIDKLMVLMLLEILVFSQLNISRIIVVSLIGIIISAMISFFENKKKTVFLSGLYLLLCVFIPETIYFVPLILYDIFVFELGIVGAIMLSVLVIVLKQKSLTVLFCLLVITVLAYMLGRKSKENEYLHQTLKRIRDDSEEKNMLLVEKNRHLLEKQDSEVYVATLKERNRIAREIHDNVGHVITRSILQMGALMTINKNQPIYPQLVLVKDNLDIAMNNIRESVHDLHDESIDLKQAVTEIVEGLGDTFCYKLEYDITNNIDKKYKYAIIGILKEAVSNIIKHSKNTDVDIIIREHPSMYQLVVRDYCKGKLRDNGNFDKIGKNDGIGLQNMEDRVATLKGNINIDTKDGYKIFVTLPK